MKTTPKPAAKPTKPAATALAAGGKPKPVAPKPKTKLGADQEEETQLDGEEVDTDADTDVEEDCDCAGQDGCECDEADEDAETDPVEMDADEEEAKQAAKLAATKARKDAQRFVTAFGASLGGKWFAAGLSFAQAQTKFNAALVQQNKKLKTRVGELAAQVTALGGEDEPISITHAEDKPNKPSNGRAAKFATHLPSGAAKFAASIKLPK